MKLSKISILHVTNNLGFGGVQKIIYQLCDATRDSFKNIKVASTGGVYVDRLKGIGIEHYDIPDLSTKNPINMLKIVRILTKIVKENHINVIHCHHRMAVFYAKLIPVKVKIVYNNHTIYSDKAKSTHRILKNVDIIADGVKARKNVTDFFGIKDENRITTINNAVDAYDGYYEEIKEITEAREEGKFIVMNSARLHPQKGMKYFVEAADILVKKGCEITFFIVGDGPLKEEIKGLVKEKKLEKNVIFLGFRKDIKNTISQCDLLVLTSVYEGLPLTPMEAFSVKKAVVATDIDGTREVVENGYNGLLAETENPLDIAEKIETMYRNREVLNKYCENAYQTYLDKFSIETFSKEYLTFYKKL